MDQCGQPLTTTCRQVPITILEFEFHGSVWSAFDGYDYHLQAGPNNNLEFVFHESAWWAFDGYDYHLQAGST